MKDRIATFIKAENKTSIQFAEEIGVQPSSVSHIISGRNNPSLDFVLKMLNKYKYISTDWLLFGKGKMYYNEMDPTLFDNNDLNNNESIDIEKSRVSIEGDKEPKLEVNQNLIFSNNLSIDKDDVDHSNNGIKVFVEKIVWFYNDNSFRVFNAK